MKISNLGPPHLPDPPDLKKGVSKKLSNTTTETSPAEQLKRGLRTFKAGQASAQNVAKPLEANPVAYTPIQIPNVPEGGGKGPNPVAYTPITIPNVPEGGGQQPNPVAYTPIQLPNVPEGGSAPPGPTPPPVMQNAVNYGVQSSATAQTVQPQSSPAVESSPVPQPLPTPELSGGVHGAQIAGVQTLPIPLPDQMVPSDKPAFTPIPLPDTLNEPATKLDPGSTFGKLRHEPDRNEGAADPIPLPKQRLGENKI